MRLKEFNIIERRNINAPTKDPLGSLIKSLPGKDTDDKLGTFLNKLPKDKPTPDVSDSSNAIMSGPPYPKEDDVAVRAMQKQLIKLGYSVGSTSVDGKYGPRTARAVAAFKKDNKITPLDGEVMTNKEMIALANAKPVKRPSKTDNPATTPLKQDAVTQGKVGAVLNLIAGPESRGQYDAVYPGRRRPQILDMTIAELIKDMRARVRSGVDSSASGRYQYIRKTLQSVVGQMGLDTATTKFTPEVQDQIATYHLRKNHSLDSWLSGRMSNERFLNKLAGTWAGIPNTSGRSTYAGDGLNKAGISVAYAINQLDQIRGVA